MCAWHVGDVLCSTWQGWPFKWRNRMSYLGNLAKVCAVWYEVTNCFFFNLFSLRDETACLEVRSLSILWMIDKMRVEYWWSGVRRYPKCSATNLSHCRVYRRSHLSEMSATTAYELCYGELRCWVELSCLPIGWARSTRILEILGSHSGWGLGFSRDLVVFLI